MYLCAVLILHYIIAVCEQFYSVCFWLNKCLQIMFYMHNYTVWIQICPNSKEYISSFYKTHNSWICTLGNRFSLKISIIHVIFLFVCIFNNVINYTQWLCTLNRLKIERTYKIWPDNVVIMIRINRRLTRFYSV